MVFSPSGLPAAASVNGNSQMLLFSAGNFVQWGDESEALLFISLLPQEIGKTLLASDFFFN